MRQLIQYRFCKTLPLVNVLETTILSLARTTAEPLLPSDTMLDAGLF